MAGERGKWRARPLAVLLSLDEGPRVVVLSQDEGPPAVVPSKDEGLSRCYCRRTRGLTRCVSVKRTRERSSRLSCIS